MRPLKHYPRKIVVPTVAAVAVTGAIAVAAIPSASGTINACYATGGLNKGNVRIVDEGVACRSGELAISWNQKGQKGDTGAAGAAGGKGDKGDTGAAGAAGAVGAAGAAGAKGDKGDAGAAGANGQDGAAGAVGAPGAKGERGDTGATGPAGPQGPVGPQGPAGPAGPSGAAAALQLGGEALAGGTADAFLSLPGVEGESVVRGHEDEIELHSFGFSLENTLSIGSASGGAGAGKVQFGNVHLTKWIDKSTPLLIKAVAIGSHWSEGKITFRQRSTGADFLTIKFSLVAVGKWEQGGKAEPPLLENVDLQVGSFQLEYRPTDPKGGLGGAVKFGWDRTKNSEENGL